MTPASDPPGAARAGPPINLCTRVADGESGLADLLQPLLGDVQAGLDLVDTGEDEICRAMLRHHADRIWHSFPLLEPTGDRLAAEPVFRAHCRELLDRVARGADTRPATAAECVIALLETGRAVPLSTSAIGLYLRMWDHAGLPDLRWGANGRAHYEALKGDQIDD